MKYRINELVITVIDEHLFPYGIINFDCGDTSCGTTETCGDTSCGDTHSCGDTSCGDTQSCGDTSCGQTEGCGDTSCGDTQSCGDTSCGQTEGCGDTSCGDTGACGTTSLGDTIAQWWTEVEWEIKVSEFNRLMTSETRAELLELLQIRSYKQLSNAGIRDLKVLERSLMVALEKVRAHIERMNLDDQF